MSLGNSHLFLDLPVGLGMKAMSPKGQIMLDFRHIESGVWPIEPTGANFSLLVGHQNIIPALA